MDACGVCDVPSSVTVHCADAANMACKNGIV